MPKNGSGVLKRLKGKTMLLDPVEYFRSGAGGILVPKELMRKYQLVEGAAVTGPVRESHMGLILEAVDSVCGLSPADFQRRKPYTRLTAVTPSQRFNLSITGQNSMRIVDLIAPIAKGTRGLIVSPPRAGKTIMLEQIAKAVHAGDPSAVGATIANSADWQHAYPE